MTVALLNTTIATADGLVSRWKIDLGTARILAATASRAGTLKSYVGHQGTAQIMETLLGVPVPVSRDLYTATEGDDALCFKLNGRPEPGRELSLAELEEIGFEWYLLVQHTTH